MTTEAALFRAATSADAVALTDLERDANLVALAHVFPDTAYPWDDVRHRWEHALADPQGPGRGVPARPTGSTSTSAGTHRPCGTWRCVRSGGGAVWARQAVERAAGVTRLWCLVENHRARGLYEHLGWRADRTRAERGVAAVPS